MKTLKSAYIGYYAEDNSEQGFKIKTFRSINATNSYTIGYVHHVSRAFNFLLGRVAFFSQRLNKPVREVIITGKDLAANIGCHASHSSYVLKTLQDLFDLEFVRHNNSHGARTIKINKRIIEFLKVYSEEEFQLYMMKYDLLSKESILRRLYERRIWETPDSQIDSREEIKAKQVFMDQKEIKNYHHYTYTSNRDDQKRISYIEKAKNHLSEIEANQLNKIKEAKENGSKLEYYLHKVLLNLEQKISYILNYVHKQKTIQEVPTHAIIERNQEKVESEGYNSALRQAQRKPENTDDSSISYTEAVQFFTVWNTIAQAEGLNTIKEITLNRYKSLDMLCKFKSKGDLFKALSNIKKLFHDESSYKYKITFDRFCKKDTFIKLLETTNYDPRTLDTLTSWEKGVEYISVVKSIKNSVPEIKTLREANSYFMNK